jgi:hypothetical protein
MGLNEDAVLWRTAADELRRRPSGGRGDPGQYALYGLARLLDALAGSAERGDDLRDEVVSAAVELARHIHRYVPGHDSDPG